MTTSSATEDQASVDVLTLPQKGRAFLVGMTESGKSTLMEIMMNLYQIAYGTIKNPVRMLIVDTKPRFRAEREINGTLTSITGRYSKWGHGSPVIPNSFVLAGRGSIRSELDTIWAHGGNIAIVQSERKSEWGYVSTVVTRFYEEYGTGTPRLVCVDELADFFEKRSQGDIFQRICRNGRERNVAMICGSQRPRKIPVEVMTELLRLYMFTIEGDEDLKHLLQFGFPRTVQSPPLHTFYMYDRKLRLMPPSNTYYTLDLAA